MNFFRPIFSAWVLVGGLAWWQISLFPSPAQALTASVQPPTTFQLAPEVVPPTPTPSPETLRSQSARSFLSALPQSGPALLTLDLAHMQDQIANEDVALQVKDRSIFGQVFDSISYWLSSLFNTVSNDLTPPTPESFVKSAGSKNPDEFWNLVSDAGYKLKEISTEVGIVPGVAFRFKYVRELSEGDVNWLERKLSHHANKYKDPISAIHRAIIHTLLSINNSDTYYVSELKIKLLPLPSAEFSIMPWDSGLSAENDILLRAIQGQKPSRSRRVEEDSHY